MKKRTVTSRSALPPPVYTKIMMEVAHLLAEKLGLQELAPLEAPSALQHLKPPEAA
eukprot:CAMPEP_0182558338 /NCGR_PEP_ID=MMETSP1324-20130603/1914_1 /TAXON_ID=236786 /ORGANISM="Florenciella sp., Strain RCC1587" /LENGTH=55 /DNA_ID=CAMNT_0024770505 /DNA_START=919 /DNA_END=1087 /DNA_ORIENTATION=+